MRRALIALLIACTLLLPAAARTVRNVSLNYVNADVVFVLKQVAKAMNYNLVVDSSVKGTVTMVLDNVPADRAFKIITTVNNLGYKTVGNTIVVGSAETLSRLP